MKAEEELLKLEKEFAEAIVKNDLQAIERIVADDWIIIDPDGGSSKQGAFLRSD
jgi:ketosteroid isomerase-like protein